LKTYLVLGAAGSLGKAVVVRFLEANHSVIAVVKNESRSAFVQAVDMGATKIFACDVGDRRDMAALGRQLFHRDVHLDGVIYVVGHCPPGGFADAIRHPLSQLPIDAYEEEIRMHQLGVLNAFQCMLRVVKDGGSFVYLSSAITRLKGGFPEFLQAHYHASVVSAEDWLVDGMRHDPIVSKRGIRIHRLAPVAIDTPFHSTGPKPSKMLKIETVVQEIISALQSKVSVDKEIA